MKEDIITGLGQLLRNIDPSNPAQLAEADALAGAVMTVAMGFVHDRLGKEAAALVMENTFEQTSALIAQHRDPEAAARILPTLHPMTPAGALAKLQRGAETMFEYLNKRTPAEGDAEARAAIWAGAAYLHRHRGERDTLDFMGFIRSKVGELGWFEQLPHASQARH